MKGRGVIAKKYFTQREFVCEYAGEVIDMKEAKKREEEWIELNVLYICIRTYRILIIFSPIYYWIGTRNVIKHDLFHMYSRSHIGNFTFRLMILS